MPPRLSGLKPPPGRVGANYGSQSVPDVVESQEINEKEPPMARPNYSFAKHQREIAKKQKKEAKRLRKEEASQDKAAEDKAAPPPPPATDNP